MSTRRSSSGTLDVPTQSIAEGCTDGDEDAGPSSEVRPLESAADRPLTAATLVVVTSLSGADAKEAWVTVTRAGGIVSFEGPLEADGRATIALGVLPGTSRVTVRLETLRWHRQAEVALRPGLNAYAFN